MDLESFPEELTKSPTLTSTLFIGCLVQSKICAEIRSPFHPESFVFFVGVTSGAIDFGNLLSIVTKELSNPGLTCDQSDKVSAVGSGSSVKVVPFV